MDPKEIVLQLSELYGFDYNEGLILTGLDRVKSIENKELNKRGRGRPRVEIKDVSIVSDSVESDIEEIEVKRSEIDGRRVLESKTGEIYCERSLELIGRRVLDRFRPLNSL